MSFIVAMTMLSTIVAGCGGGDQGDEGVAQITRFSTSDTLVTAGDVVTLDIQFVGESAVLNPGGIVVNNGALQVGPLNETTTYELRVVGEDGESITVEKTIEVVPMPRIVSFAPESPSVAPAGTVRLWIEYEHGEGNLHAAGAGAAKAVLSQQYAESHALMQSAQFTLRVTNPAGAIVEQTVSVAVTPEMYVSNFNTASVQVFPLAGTGATAPLRIIKGAATELKNPRGLQLRNGELFVADPTAKAILVFDADASGNIAPLRKIAGATTQLEAPSGLWIEGNEIFVGDQSDSIKVFALTANGNIAPKRVIRPQGLDHSHYSYVSGGELYLTAFQANKVFVVSPNASGVVVPTRAISVAAEGAQPLSVLVHGGDVIVAGGEASIGTYDAQTGVKKRGIAGANSMLTAINDQCALLGNEVVCTSFEGNAVNIFSTAANGNVPPLRRIVGVGTTLNGPLGIALRH